MDPVPLLALDEPFTPAMAAQAGIGRAALDRLHRQGRVVRILRGVYLEVDVPLTSMSRARAAALRLGGSQVLVDRTAAWIHGAGGVGAGGPIPVEVHGRRSRWGASVPLAPGDVVLVGGVRCTAPVRTAFDVGRRLAPERALPLLDGLLRAGALTHPELISACRPAAASSVPGFAQFRELAALADGRAEDLAESVLRLRWLGASLPTPTPGVRVAGVRTALALPTQRFGAVIAGRHPAVDMARCEASGWRILVLHRDRVLASDPEFLVEHLEREFLRHLLQQVCPAP